MKKNSLLYFIILYGIILIGFRDPNDLTSFVDNEYLDTLPPPYETKSVKNFSKVIGWKDGATPVAPPGFTVTKFADGLEHPRWIYVADNGDIFIAESNTILKGILKLGQWRAATPLLPSVLPALWHGPLVGTFVSIWLDPRHPQGLR